MDFTLRSSKASFLDRPDRPITAKHLEGNRSNLPKTPVTKFVGVKRPPPNSHNHRTTLANPKTLNAITNKTFSQEKLGNGDALSSTLQSDASSSPINGSKSSRPSSRGGMSRKGSIVSLSAATASMMSTMARRSSFQTSPNKRRMTRTLTVESPPLPIGKITGVSTVAKQMQRRKEKDVVLLEAAKRSRQAKECGVLMFRVESRREQVDRIQTRMAYLQNENVELIKQIQEIEAVSMNQVHNNLQSTTVMGEVGQGEIRRLQQQIIDMEKVRTQARAERDATKQLAEETLEAYDMRLLSEANELKELLMYKSVGQFEDERYTERLKQRHVELGLKCQELVQLATERATIAKQTYVDEANAEQEKIMTAATNKKMAAMSPRSMSVAANNIDISQELKTQTAIGNQLKERIAVLLQENKNLKDECHLLTRLNGTNRSTMKQSVHPSCDDLNGVVHAGYLPTRVNQSNNHNLVSKMANLAAATGFD